MHDVPYAAGRAQFLSLWAMTTVVRPCDRRLSAVWIAVSFSGSACAVATSKKNGQA